MLTFLHGGCTSDGPRARTGALVALRAPLASFDPLSFTPSGGVLSLGSLRGAGGDADGVDGVAPTDFAADTQRAAGMASVCCPRRQPSSYQQRRRQGEAQGKPSRRHDWLTSERSSSKNQIICVRPTLRPKTHQHTHEGWSYTAYW